MYLFPLRFLQGMLVGFGAILPGVSGGALCASFGMYKILIDCFAHPFAQLKRHGVHLAVFALGIGVGFVGLSGVAAWCLERNAAVVCCAFVGFIAGTLPSLWKDAGVRGRTRADGISCIFGFALLLAVLLVLKRGSLMISAGVWGYALCGVLWGLSLIVPGLSSSSLLLFFGLYEPMLAGIASFDFGVLFPLGFSMLLCVLLLAKAVGRLYETQYGLVSHAVFGIICATAVSIVPWAELTVWCVLAICSGFVLSWSFERVTQKKTRTSLGDVLSGKFSL